MKTQSKDVVSWEKWVLFNENVLLKGRFINQKTLKLPMCSYAEERLSTHYKTWIRYLWYNEVHRKDAVASLLIFWFLGNVLCLWQDSVPIFGSLNLPEKRHHFVWDSLYHSSSVDKSLLWLMQVFVCLKRESTTVYSVARMIQIWL